MYHLLNVVAGPAGDLNIVLIRAVEPLQGIDYAKDYKDKPWRYHIKKNAYVSRG